MPATISTTIAQRSSSGPRRSHRKSGTPSSRRTDSAFGTVQIRSGRAERSVTGGAVVPSCGTDGAADGPFDDVTFPPAPAPPCPRLVEGPRPPHRSQARGEPPDGATERGPLAGSRRVPARGGPLPPLRQTGTARAAGAGS